MATARDLIEAALREIGVLASSETAPAQEATDALARLNRYIARLEAGDKLTIYTVTRSTWTIVSGTQSYTVGAGQTINITRPIYIERVQFVDLSLVIEFPLRQLTDAGYASIATKAQQSNYPEAWYYNPIFPAARLHFWPIPTSSTLLGVIYHWEAVAQIAALSTTISLPPGYEEMLITNLALLLCPSYERQPNPALVDAARESKAAIKRANQRLSDLSFDQAALIGSRGTYSIYEG